MKILLLVIALVFCSEVVSSQEPTPDCQDLKQQAIEMQAILQDWPKLQRYAKADTELSASTNNQPRVVFMGDSITDLWKLDEYFPNEHYVNRGISGQTTPQMLIRFRPDVIDLRPKVVVILAGTNDIAGNTGPMTLEMIEANLASMAELAHVHSIKVVLASVLPVSDYTSHPQTNGRPPDKIRQLNGWMKQYCKDHKLIYLDYFSHTVDEKGFLRAGISDDGLHPNAVGYKIMAPLAEQAIRQALH